MCACVAELLHLNAIYTCMIPCVRLHSQSWKHPHRTNFESIEYVQTKNFERRVCIKRILDERNQKQKIIDRKKIANTPTSRKQFPVCSCVKSFSSVRRNELYERPIHNKSTRTNIQVNRFALAHTISIR